jgi:GNAT superfamily N-acetyltransferase
VLVQRLLGEYEIDDSSDRLDFASVHRWLSATYWWQAGLSRETTETGARHSALVIGAYQGDQQVGYARVVSDRIRFAWVADVYVDEAHRGRGIARAMVRFALDHPQLRDVTRWMLATRDAHGVYAALGFAAPADPDQILQLIRERAR